MVAFAMASWATNALPELTTGLAFFALASLGQLASPNVIFTGFSSSAFWLVLSGMVIAQAMNKTGLGRRVASLVAAPLSTSYARLIIGILLISYGLAFVMPSNIGRISLLLPIALAIADQVGLDEGRPGRTGVVLAVGFGTFILSTTILPANVPNLVMAGAIEALYDVRLSYIHYLVLHAPVLGLAKGGVLAGLICRQFPDRISPKLAAIEGAVVDGPVSRAPISLTSVQPPMSAAERRLAVILIATLGLWLTEGVHGLAPAWVGLAAAVVCLLPGVAVIGPEAFNDVNHRTVLYVAALLGVVAVISETGLATSLSKAVLSFLPLRAGENAWNFVLLVLLSLAISLVASANAVGAIYTALANDLVQATGLPLNTVLMIQVLGFSTVLFSYQAPPIAVAIGLGKVSVLDASRLGVRLAILTLLLLLPLDYLWWRLLGVI